MQGLGVRGPVSGVGAGAERELWQKTLKEEAGEP